ncbi:MAG: TraR/DksA C4-type zinc finger protein [Candidatus Campbellbacteria bacterium]|nr:TraR/DksA C4-type zinc finger protein [Candidatus Campbellbacteria bacterium]
MRKDIDTNYFKKRLEEEKKLLLEGLGRAGDQHDKLDKENWEGELRDLNIQEADRNEAADEQEEFYETSVITEELESQLRAVNDAIEKIENGTYGICEVSGEPIEKDRLEANPAARTSKAHMND